VEDRTGRRRVERGRESLKEKKCEQTKGDRAREWKERTRARKKEKEKKPCGRQCP
jgi:hypothetical protein